jgi:hypothetical protein
LIQRLHTSVKGPEKFKPDAQSTAMNISTPAQGPRSFSFCHPELRGATVEFSRDDDRHAIVEKNFGNLKGTLFVAELADSLGLGPDDADRKLLSIVPDALRHVRTLKSDDLVPTELITGQPSWQPGQQSVSRATMSLSRALQHRLYGRHKEPKVTGTALPIEVKDLVLLAPAILKGMANNEAAARLEAVVLDLARLDRLRRAISDLQRTVGELAQFSVRYAKYPVGSLAKGAAVQLRAAVVWGTQQAVAADAAMGDILALIDNPERASDRAWPVMRRLRVLMLDCEPVIARWLASKHLQSGTPVKEVEEVYRLVMRRYKTFDPSIFNDRMLAHVALED